MAAAEHGSNRGSLLVFSDDWDRHPSSCQHLIRQLLPDYSVAWVNTIGTRRPTFDWSTVRRGGEKLASWLRPNGNHAALPAGLQVISPRMWPYFTRPRDRALNRWLLRKSLVPEILRLPQPVTAITTLPIVADLVGELPVKRWVYYCVDDFGSWPGLDQSTMNAMEKVLVERADTLVAVSETLQQRLAAQGRSAGLLTHGVDVEHWQAAPAALALPELAAHERPLVVFWGVIDQRMDVAFLTALGRQMTHGTILLVGPRDSPDPALWRVPRVAHVPALTYQQLPHVAAAARVLIMPYRDLPVTRAMQPLKLKEYLATGKPTVVRDLPATRDWADGLDLATTPDEFAAAVCRHLQAPAAPVALPASLAAESWAAKARQFADFALN